MYIAYVYTIYEHLQCFECTITWSEFVKWEAEIQSSYL